MIKHSFKGDIFAMICSIIVIVMCTGGIIYYWGTGHTNAYYIIGNVDGIIEYIDDGIFLWRHQKTSRRKHEK